ncbi:uncharacterized protein APUU_11612A [Aspergillus puulaauensis]|uniref:Uncharacterized protein n=1 Tax=Aspergillus puulaauensis TaxID=1220207 RepID=A0A7R7XCG1_9EURO|nr:uncharacterized protein APUU_11612A [Aspergillus puulaauensis]BCS18784.1 hypothetical protein APUU_11612A [Aspergillus puulaauensis]
MDTIRTILAQAGNTTKAADGIVVCVSPFSSSFSLLPRLHVYFCFTVATAFWPFYNTRPVKAAYVFSIFYAVLSAVHSAANFALLARGSTRDHFLGPDLFHHYRTIALGIFFCTRLVYSPRGRPLTNDQFKLIHSLLIVLAVAGVAGNIAIRHVARNITSNESICQAAHAVLLPQKIVLGDHSKYDGLFSSLEETPYISIHPWANARISQPTSKVTPNTFFQALKLAGRAILLYNDSGFIIVTTAVLLSVQAEIIYYNLQFPASLTSGILPHWSIWVLTLLYLTTEAGIWIHGLPERLRQERTARHKKEAAEAEIQRILKPLKDGEIHIYLQPREDIQPPYGGEITYEEAALYCRALPEFIPVFEDLIRLLKANKEMKTRLAR